MVPPLFLIFLVLGTIFIGVATPTEGGAMGASGAILLAIFKRWLDRNPNRFNLALLKSAVEATAKLSAFVVFILVGARIFSLTFYGVNGHVWVEHLFTSLPGGQVGFLIFINVLVFLLAFFLDFFEIAFIVIPLIGPAAEKIGIDLIWLGVMLGVNMQTSFMHPPFGFALFYLRSVAAREPYKDRVTGSDDGAGDDGPNLLGGSPLCRYPVHHGWLGHRLPANGNALQEPGAHRGSEQNRDPHPSIRSAIWVAIRGTCGRFEHTAAATPRLQPTLPPYGASAPIQPCGHVDAIGLAAAIATRAC